MIQIKNTYLVMLISVYFKIKGKTRGKHIIVNSQNSEKIPKIETKIITNNQ